MKRQSIIIITIPGQHPEPWGNFKKMCLTKGFPYHTLKALKMPITHTDKAGVEYVIYREPFK
jgi:hypothetical protein